MPRRSLTFSHSFGFILVFLDVCIPTSFMEEGWCVLRPFGGAMPSHDAQRI